jgi:histidinol-phosphate/aromatic aminotransferase/cobyric acid decarboxylase-like protein
MTDHLRAITTVYSYLMPEVREVISRLTARYPHDVFLRSVSPGLDDFHHRTFDRLVSAYATEVPALGGFAHRYPTAGCEEAIREYVSHLALRGVGEIHVFKGDYEGYREVAKTRGIETVEHELDDPALATLAPGYFFVSNPFARDGRILPDELFRRLCERGHKIFYDLSYAGSTSPHTYDLAHENIEVAAVSFSKPYGLFYYRVGFTFSRVEIPALYANKWFKNVLSLLIAEEVLAMDRTALVHKYKSLQAGIIERLNADHGPALAPAEPFLLATAAAQPTVAALEKFRRHDRYRLCLTPYFLELEGRT